MSALANSRAQVIMNHLSAGTPGATYRAGLVQGEVVIITGAGQGIGAATALIFGREGANVVVADLDAAKGEEVARQIIAAGGKAIAVAGDVTDYAYPERLIAETIKAYGKINHIVNNAGFALDAMLHKTTDKAFTLMNEVHCAGPFRIIRAAAPYMRLTDGANRSIVNISSTTGTHGNTGQTSYSVAKAGILGLTKTICKEWGRFGVRCNTVAFGYIDTRLTRAQENGDVIVVDGQKVALGIPTRSSNSVVKPGAAFNEIPLGRPGQAEEAAGPVFFLCTPLAAYVSGQTLEVTGGKAI